MNRKSKNGGRKMNADTRGWLYKRRTIDAMEVVFACEKHVTTSFSSLFLAGPSPCKETDYNWRPEALRILSNLGYTGTVFVPLMRERPWACFGKLQALWEWEYLDKASVIAFWVPRDLESLPGFTTNVEYGLYVRSGKIVLGFPGSALKMSYLIYLAERYNILVAHTLHETLYHSLVLMNQRIMRNVVI